MGSISLTQAGTMSGFVADSRLACHRDVCVWTDDPDFAVLKKVTFTSTATDDQDDYWYYLIFYYRWCPQGIFLLKMAIMMETAFVGSEMLNCFEWYLAGSCALLKPWQR